jgi:protein-tyrosine phosphatase
LGISVLMICLGNICRSPMAEGALRRHVDHIGLNTQIDSAGTGDWHVGHPPDHRAQAVAMRLGGIDISGLRARQVSHVDFSRFDHVIAMDAANLGDLQEMAPEAARGRLSLLLDHLPGQEGRAVADPYYGDIADFERCWREIDCATAALAKKLRQ